MADQCEYPGCDQNNDDDVYVHAYGFTIDGLIEVEYDLCDEHAPTPDSIAPPMIMEG